MVMLSFELPCQPCCDGRTAITTGDISVPPSQDLAPAEQPDRVDASNDEEVVEGMLQKECSTGVALASTSKKQVTLLTSRSCKSLKEGDASDCEGRPRAVSLSTRAPTSPADEEPTPATRRASRRLNTASRAVRRLTARLTRRQSTLFTASRRVPAAQVPAGTAPIFSQKLPDATIAGLRAALEREEHCPLLRFMREVLLCIDISSTDWKESPDVEGTLVRKSYYTIPIPRNIPEAIAKMVGVPETIRSSTVWRLKSSDRELTLVQQSYTKDVRFGDRLTVQNTISFCEGDEGGVLLRQWAEVVWLKPLPWTHGILKHFVEKRAKADTESTAGVLAQIVQEEAVRQMDARSGDPMDPCI